MSAFAQQPFIALKNFSMKLSLRLFAAGRVEAFSRPLKKNTVRREYIHTIASAAAVTPLRRTPASRPIRAAGLISQILSSEISGPREETAAREINTSRIHTKESSDDCV